MAQISKSKRKANPMLTKNGRTRLKPLNITQLQGLLDKANRPKDKDKILRRIRVIESRK